MIKKYQFPCIFILFLQMIFMLVYFALPSDVVVGSLLGFGCAFLAYRQYYPSLSGTRAGSPVHSVKLRHTSEVESTEGHFV